MIDFLYSHFDHVLCGLILISRIADIGSTYLVTPKLLLEANPVARKLGWKFALLTLLICLLPYYSTSLAMMALVPFLFVSSSNTAKIWFVRSYGEKEYLELIRNMAHKSKLSHAIAGVLGASFFLCLAGLVLLLVSPTPNVWGFWFALGIILYAFIIAIHGSLYFMRLFKSVRNGGSP